MPDVNDIDLLREYADRRSESAFSDLVRRHVNLVYSVALRFTGNFQDAQDVTQAVFIILAQKAKRLGQKTILTGWLYETTRFTAMKLLRTKARQQAREQVAYMQSTLNDAENESIWKQLAPLLEEGMSRLSEKDRTLLALRFFENKSGAETAKLLGVQEWAAHKRLNRAVEKLQKFFLQRGVSSTTAAIAGAMTANSIQAAPPALAKAATAAALAQSATACGSTFAIIKGLQLMAWTNAKTAIVTTAVVGLATLSVVEHQRQATLLHQNKVLRQQVGQISKLETDNQNLSNLLVQANTSEMLAKNQLRDFLQTRANGQGASKLQAEASPANFAPSPPPKAAGDELPKTSWSNAGFGTPQAALQTRGWAVLNGDRDLFKQSLSITDDARKFAEDALVQMAQASTDPNKAQYIQEILNNKYGVEEGLLMPMMAANQTKNYTGYKILSQQSPSADEMVLGVETEMASAPSETETLKLQRFGGDWKVVIDKETIQKMMNQ